MSEGSRGVSEGASSVVALFLILIAALGVTRGQPLDQTHRREEAIAGLLEQPAGSPP